MSNIVVLSGTIKVPVIETIITKENLFLRVLLPDALGADHVKVFLDNSTLRVEADLLTGTSRLLSIHYFDIERIFIRLKTYRAKLTYTDT